MSVGLPLLQLSAALIGLCGALTSAQRLSDMANWRDANALGWELQRLRRRTLTRSHAAALVFAQPGLTILVAAQLVASLALIARPGLAAMIALLVCFLVAALLLALRSSADGGDKIVTIATTGALLQAAGVWLDQPRLALAGVLWAGGQLTIAYFASGASKVLLDPWRRGEALSAALTSFMFGHRWTAPLVRNAKVTRWLAWAIILLELAFPLALLAPTSWLCTVLAGFFLFHLAIAVVMGLNHYPWAFLATYPSVVLLGQWLRSVLGLT